MSDKICELAGCNKKARKRFCCNRHKDRYHNMTNPRGKFAHLHPDNLDDEIHDNVGHPHEAGFFGHGQN